MTSLLLGEELTMSLRVIFDLAFAVTLLTLRCIVVLIADAHRYRVLQWRAPRSIFLNESSWAIIVTENAP